MAAAGGWVALLPGTTFLGSPRRGCSQAPGSCGPGVPEQGREERAARTPTLSAPGSSVPSRGGHPALTAPPSPMRGLSGHGEHSEQGWGKGQGLGEQGRFEQGLTRAAGGQHRLKSLL